MVHLSEEIWRGRETELALFGCRIRAPEGINLRLDQPCVHEHGSVGGWLTTEKGELTFTLLWRRLCYWKASADPTDVPASEQGWITLNDEFVRAAVVSSRRDAARAAIVHQREASGPSVHPGVDIALRLRPRRRRMRVIELHRRQMLWTCPESRRHLAFEVSVLAGSGVDLDAAFERFVPTLGCHSEEDRPDCPAPAAGARVRIR